MLMRSIVIDLIGSAIEARVVVDKIKKRPLLTQCTIQTVISQERIRIFSTGRNLQLLSISQDWFVEATFKVYPRPFVQLYTIHGLYNRTVLQRVYALLPGKSTNKYSRPFGYLGSNFASPDPTRIMMDFEQASISALRTVYPSSSIRGFYFHFSQFVWRKIQENP
ncbi:hypothetical protein RF11_10337 [Thelohanellus kitauei]|uniref:MULE transposase domain-containing protein n=1 Tax=Thelohanellus kitauei TaxID=669202 RepID=A0A0C2NL44_THEKT|nr:hypothetical protein RF11_05523 [Thelohanellus kitauei]KII74727.1 hypothetical protein RF11_10337 [Thelohanellus kitauei]